MGRRKLKNNKHSHFNNIEAARSNTNLDITKHIQI